MKEIRVGIIGTGTISNMHMRKYSYMPNVKVVCAAEIDEAKLKAWGERYGVTELYTDFREMLKRDDLDVVDVCAHNNLHVPLAMSVMKAGFNCYSEKPMAATYADAKMLYDCWKATGVKLNIQIASLFSEQTRIGKRLIDEGVLGQVYHAHSVNVSYRRRVSVEWDGTRDFLSREIAGHGSTIDHGIYDFGQVLYMLDLPELESVYARARQMFDIPIPGRVSEVEDNTIALATFKNDITFDILEASATNMDDVGKCYIAGEKGALQYWNVDKFGGDWGLGQPPKHQLPPQMQPQIRFIGNYKGIHVNADLRAYENQTLNKTYDPETRIWYDGQYQWIKYLAGELEEDKIYKTPLIGLNVALLCDGIFLSTEQRRSVTADEIKELSPTMAIWHQKTPWGIFDYDSSF